ncbi:MAG: hypothetical protein J6Q99_03955 [Oscillospiraceae bacterium]|nr:hypothetical protein [Oscillospiraceae bacterium]
MEHRNQFTEEMLRQLYQRRGYQVMRLCGEVSADRQKTMELTFQAFGEANRRLAAAEQPLTTEYQDQVLLECTRSVIAQAMPQPAEEAFVAQEQPVEEEPAQELLPLEDLLAEEPDPIPQPVEEEPAEELPVEEAPVLEDAPTMAEKYNDMPKEEQEEPAPLDLTDTSGSNFGWGLLVLILVLVVLGLLWAIWGVAQTIFPLPQLDLGYQWFNSNVYPLF